MRHALKRARPEPPPMPANHTRAYCYASGLIEFGRYVPSGAILIARGPEQSLRDFISSQARHGYDTVRDAEQRPAKVPGSDKLLVPGVPEARSEGARMRALEAWIDRLTACAPEGVLVI